MKGSYVLVCDAKHLVCLVCLDECRREFFHGLTCNGLGKGNDEVIVQISLTILCYLFEIGRGWLDEVHDGEVGDALSILINVLVEENVAAAQRANVHDRSDNILTIRVKNESFESEQ